MFEDFILFIKKKSYIIQIIFVNLWIAMKILKLTSFFFNGIFNFVCINLFISYKRILWILLLIKEYYPTYVKKIVSLRNISIKYYSNLELKKMIIMIITISL